MCGIAGIVQLRGRYVYPLPELVRDMTNRLKHRGPDDEGYLLTDLQTVVPAFGEQTSNEALNRYGLKPLMEAMAEPRVVLGHRRLSILDLSVAGHQPMASEDGKLWIIHNGEIYNYIELRDELRQQGYTFKTNTDTEVLLAAYRHWGERMSLRLNGQWAFVIFDLEKKLLFASRDAFGVKPFYFFKTDDFFAFASEQKALYWLPMFQTRLNHKAFFDYYTMGKIESDQEGFYKNLLELMPGSNLTLDLTDNIMKSWHYFTLGYKTDYRGLNEDKYIKQAATVRRMIKSNLALRTRADVPIGFCLSGGIDSSSIVTLMHKIKEEGPEDRNKPLDLFTVIHKEKAFDESKYAKLVVDAVGGNWHKVAPTPQEFWDAAEDLVYIQDVPFLGVNTFSQYAMMREVSKHGIKVTIDGQGADEMFSGYTHHYIAYMNELINFGSYGEYLLNLLVGNNNFASRQALMTHYGKALIAWYRKNNDGRPIERGDIRENGYIRSEIWDRYKKRLSLDVPILLNGTLFKDYTGHTLKTQLRNADRNSMRFGVETRTPFADDRQLAEFVFKLAGSYKVSYGTSKILLRQALGLTLPKQILNRRDKMGFATPQSAWLLSLKKEFKGILETSNEIRHVLDVKGLAKDYDSLVRRGQGGRIWRAINFAMWRKIHKV